MLNSATGTMSNSISYGNERTITSTSSLEPEYGIDPASGGFFHADSKKHDDLKEMLDSNKDSLKLEAMKRIIGMIAKGRDASMLFPAVVKNVVSKNIEVKKLVYVYLERYAEEQQDLALLSISTFQRALKEPNQLIRAGALRVLSSIRVSMIAPIVMLAIRDAAQDMSPYVRKTAAHAIPKLYSLDNETKSELIVIIQKLLADKTVLVIGSAVMAFTKVCPERVNLIHQVYRKLCTLLVDVDEWGQVIILNTLTRYCRTQFADPNLNEKEFDKNFYDSNSDSSDKHTAPSLDPDHRLLLRSARPLLQSRNAAVVVAVAQLYHHCAPRSEGLLAAKALVRLLRSHTEVQCIVLDVIASMSYQRKGMFEYYLKNFFIRTSDPTRIKLLKLDILTNISCDANVSLILREMQTYILSNDKQFAAATIQAIGRCACQIADIADSCLNGLVSLLSNGNEAIVAESVIVIKRLLQTKAADPKEIVKHMTKLLDTITVPNARAAILWLLGEHAAIVPHIAPDILRKMAKSFPEEQGIVKLQVLNLAVKLYIRNERQTKLICKFIFTLARYDQDYDIRDRARLLKPFTENSKLHGLSSRIGDIFLVSKPAPLLQSQFKDREDLQLGSLSHFINMRAIGYESLPPFPEVPPPSDVRDVEPIIEETKPKSTKKESFSWVSGSSVASSYESDFSGSSSSVLSDLNESIKENKYSGQSATESTESESSEEETSDEDEDDDGEEEEDDEDDDQDYEDDEEEENSVKEQGDFRTPKPVLKNEKSQQNNTQSNYYSKNLDLLLDLNMGDDIITSTPVMMPSNTLFTPVNNNSQIDYVAPHFIPTKTMNLLDRIRGKGLNVNYKFSRTPHMFNRTMVNISLTFINTGKEEIKNITIGQEEVDTESLQSFGNISSLTPGFSVPASIGIDFKDKISTVCFDLVSSLGTYKVSIVPTVGELMRPITMPLFVFNAEQEKLRGMHDESVTIKSTSLSNISQKIFEIANVGLVDSSKDEIRFSGETLKTSTLVLVSVIFEKEDKITLRVNCDKYPFGTILLNELKSILQQ